MNGNCCTCGGGGKIGDSLDKEWIYDYFFLSKVCNYNICALALFNSIDPLFITVCSFCFWSSLCLN